MNVKCNDKRNSEAQCFAYSYGFCTCLQENFNKNCPFYKTVEQAKASELKAKKRLQMLRGK